MKKSLLFILILIIINISVCFAANPKVQINGKIIDFKDDAGNVVEAQLINNRTMVPLRKIFEELKCSVDWEQSTKTVTATKDNKIIKLTIGNKEAIKIIDSKEEKITLDSEPVIVDNRTLVPLRFIGESLGNDVGWDQSAQTAIIIDYGEIANLINSKSSYMYASAIKANKIEFEKRYYDDADSTRNNKTHFSFDYSDNASNGSTVNISVTGNSDLFSEIENEGWNNFSYSINGDEFLSSNYVFSKMFNSDKNKSFTVGYDTYGLSTNKMSSVEEWIKNISNIDTTSINVNTYKNLKNDWNKFINTFFNGKRTLKTSDFEYSFIDIKSIYTTRVESEAINAMFLLNSVCFRLDLNYQDLLVDYPTSTYEFINNSNSGVTIKVALKNEYKERIEYEVTFK